MTVDKQKASKILSIICIILNIRALLTIVVPTGNLIWIWGIILVCISSFIYLVIYGLLLNEDASIFSDLFLLYIPLAAFTAVFISSSGGGEYNLELSIVSFAIVSVLSLLFIIHKKKSKDTYLVGSRFKKIYVSVIAIIGLLTLIIETIALRMEDHESTTFIVLRNFGVYVFLLLFTSYIIIVAIIIKGYIARRKKKIEQMIKERKEELDNVIWLYEEKRSQTWPLQTVDKVIFKIDKNKGKTKFSLLLNWNK